MPGLMLIDGNSLAYRAFHALPQDIALASGQITNAVYGFTSMLLNLIRDHKPDDIVVAFDRPERTFRHDAIETYKGNRAKAPDVLREQMGLVRQVVETLRLPIVDAPGYEADDVIATLATRARDAGEKVLIVSGDRDEFQLVEDPLVTMLYNRRGVSDYVEYDEAGIAEKTGVPPRLYSQYAALRGDTSDNLPGVPGVGEKTAAKLITTYGGIDGIYEHVDEQTPRLRANLLESEAQVRANAHVMVLVRDVPLEVDLDDVRSEPFDREEVRKLFDFLEFRTLHDRLAEAYPEREGPPENAEQIEAEVTAMGGPAEAVELLDRLAAGPQTDLLALDAAWAGAEGRSEIEGLAFVTDETLGDVAWVPGDLLKHDDVAAALTRLVGEDGRRLAAHGAKALMRALLVAGVDVGRLALDTQIAAYLLDPAESRYLLPEILVRYANLCLPTEGGPAEGQLDLEGSGVPPALEAGRRALAVARLVEPLSQELADQGMSRLNDEIEIPLVRVLARMEHAGVGVDVAELRRLNDDMANQVAELTHQIYEDAGTEFVINSTPQLRQILFDKLGLSPQKRTKTGFSTDAASLQRLAGQHTIIDHLLQYREVEKLRSTYGEGLLSEVQPDGRIRATFNQTVARTGRLSSDAPNLHNIPVRSDVGRAFRKAFIPAAGCEFLIADYNQIELRCIAHLADDPGLIAAFESGTDIHNATASRVFAVAPADVTIDMRSKAKMVSYGLAYGMESYGLSQRLNIPVEEAAEILRAYFEAFPHVREYMERTVTEARLRGYTETLFGRKRFIPELMSDNFRVRQAGERQAMNAGIQGLAADIFKAALVRLDGALEASRLRSRLVLQVHDEVILEVPPDEHDRGAELTLEAMAGAADLRVPLEANLSFGATWADAKG